MKLRPIRLAMLAGAAALALILLGGLTLLLSSVDNVHATETPAETSERAESLSALRAISIPFGIESTLVMNADGSAITARGHGVCWEEAQMFDVRITLAQSTTEAFAEGRSVDVCTGERQTWEAQAPAADQNLFEAGPAKACAEAVELVPHGVADDHMWCKDVELTQPEDNQ